jgi:hypothetical protein
MVEGFIVLLGLISDVLISRGHISLNSQTTTLKNIPRILSKNRGKFPKFVLSRKMPWIQTSEIFQNIEMIPFRIFFISAPLKWRAETKKMRK